MATTREAQRRETAARVLASAGELFRRRGFAATTIRDIAGACGVSVGTVMSVGDKDALLVASFDQAIESVHQRRAEHVEPVDAGGCVDQVMRLLGPFVEIFASDLALARVYGSILIAGGHDSIVFTRLSIVLIGEIEAVLRRVEGVGGRGPHLARALYYAYIGRLFTWLPQDGGVGDLRRSLHQLVAAICPAEEPSR